MLIEHRDPFREQGDTPSVPRGVRLQCLNGSPRVGLRSPPGLRHPRLRGQARSLCSPRLPNAGALALPRLVSLAGAGATFRRQEGRRSTGPCNRAAVASTLSPRPESWAICSGPADLCTGTGPARDVRVSVGISVPYGPCPWGCPLHCAQPSRPAVRVRGFRLAPDVSHHFRCWPELSV